MYTVRIPIKTSPMDERYFNKCFFFAWKVNNILVTHVKKRLATLLNSKTYRRARQEYGSKFSKKAMKDRGIKKLSPKEKKRKDELVSIMNREQKTVGLDKTSIYRYIAVQQHKYSRYLSSHQAQAIANNVLTGAAKILYGDGTELHYKRANDFDTISQKDGGGAALFKDWKHIRYKKKIFRLKTPDTEYMKAVISRHDPIKFCYLKRVEFNSGWKYYVVVIIDGEAPHKKKPDTKNKVGLDIGTSTVAADSDKAVMLENLAPNSIAYEKKIRHLQRLLDHKIRLANPFNYNPDGTVRKGRRHKWVITKAAKRLKRQIRVLYRKESAYVHCSHREQINRILAAAGEVIIEPVSVKSLQKKVKKTERNKKASVIKGKLVYKYKRKKRYGHSIKNHSPGYFIAELERKALLADIPYFEICTAKYKASQFHHDTGEYIKAPVEERYKEIEGKNVQRDLYSAFLIRHADNTLEKPDIPACERDFSNFVKLSNQKLAEMRSAGISNKACWGF